MARSTVQFESRLIYNLKHHENDKRIISSIITCNQVNLVSITRLISHTDHKSAVVLRSGKEQIVVRQVRNGNRSAF